MKLSHQSAMERLTIEISIISKDTPTYCDDTLRFLWHKSHSYMFHPLIWSSVKMLSTRCRVSHKGWKVTVRNVKGQIVMDSSTYKNSTIDLYINLCIYLRPNLKFPNENWVSSFKILSIAFREFITNGP